MASPLVTTVTFVVAGEPASQGSKRAFVRGGRAVLVETSANTRPWRDSVKAAAIDAMTKTQWHTAWKGSTPALDPPLTGPVSVELQLHYTRPRSHHRTGRWAHHLRPDAPEYVTKAPDIDKAARAILDALTGICYRDDSQVAVLYAVKLWADDGRAYAHITVKSLGRGSDQATTQ